MKKATVRRSGAATMCALFVVTGGIGAGCNQEKVDTNGPPPTAVPIRRLTNAEYTATVADLFPGYTLPSLVFVPDPKVLGFVNLSSSQTGSLVRMEQYEAAAFSISQVVTADPTTLTGCDAEQRGIGYQHATQHGCDDCRHSARAERARRHVDQNCRR